METLYIWRELVSHVYLSLFNGLYAQLHYFLNLSQLLVSCLPLLAKLINSGVVCLTSVVTETIITHLN